MGCGCGCDLAQILIEHRTVDYSVNGVARNEHGNSGLDKSKEANTGTDSGLSSCG
jgi:hypothetical protein